MAINSGISLLVFNRTLSSVVLTTMIIDQMLQKIGMPCNNYCFDEFVANIKACVCFNVMCNVVCLLQEWVPRGRSGQEEDTRPSCIRSRRFQVDRTCSRRQFCEQLNSLTTFPCLFLSMFPQKCSVCGNVLTIILPSLSASYKR